MSYQTDLLKNVDFIEIHRVHNGYQLYVEPSRPGEFCARCPYVFKDLYEVKSFLDAQGFDRLEITT